MLLLLLNNHKVWDSLIVFIIIFHIILCPYTKVEESFNTQAMHDIIFYKNDLENYDHHTFPGVVPRTFIGALIISIFSLPFKFIIDIIFENNNKLYMLYIVRIILGLLAAISINKLRRSISKRFQCAELSGIYALIFMSQFHLPFYLSRPLPNTFATILMCYGFSLWLEWKHYNAIGIFAIATIIFRCDMIILAGPIILFMLLYQHISLITLLKTGILYSLCAIVFTIVIDSIFWNRWVWPEFSVLAFNTFSSGMKASEAWGVSSWHWYFTVAIPKSLTFGLLVLPFGLLSIDKQKGMFRLDPHMLYYLLPALLFIICYSYLPHKELRFIFPAIIILNISVSRGIMWFQLQLKHNFLKHISLLLIMLCFIPTSFLTYLSSINYPGGYMFKKAHEFLIIHPHGKNTPIIHIDNLAATTGVTRFGEYNLIAKYDKTERLQLNHLVKYDYLINESNQIDGFQNLFNITAFSHLSKEKPYIHIQPKLYFHKRIL